MFRGTQPAAQHKVGGTLFRRFAIAAAATAPTSSTQRQPAPQHYFLQRRAKAISAVLAPVEEEKQDPITNHLRVADADELVDSQHRPENVKPVRVKPDYPDPKPREWHAEPTIADIDRSIPQVDVQFVAELLGQRAAERERKAEAFFRAYQERRDAKAKAARDGSDGEVFRANTGGAEKKPQQAEEGLLEKGAASEKAKDGGGNNNDEAGGAFEDDEEAPDYVQHEYDDQITIIDCRTVNEVTSWGMIDTAKILPGHEFWAAMHLEPDEFSELYGFRKPDKERDIVLFYCQYGPRSLVAAQLASFLGYQKPLHLRKGYYEWGKQYNLLCSRFLASDLSTGYNNKRLTELHVAKGISRDIAPELNKIVDRDTDALKRDESRSYGKLQIETPQFVIDFRGQIESANDEREAKLVEWERMGKNLLEETLKERDARMALQSASLDMARLPAPHRGDSAGGKAEPAAGGDKAEQQQPASGEAAAPSSSATTTSTPAASSQIKPKTAVPDALNDAPLDSPEGGQSGVLTFMGDKNQKSMSGRIGYAQFMGDRGGMDLDDQEDMKMPLHMRKKHAKGHHRGHFESKTRKGKL